MTSKKNGNIEILKATGRDMKRDAGRLGLFLAVNAGMLIAFGERAALAILAFFGYRPGIRNA